MFGLPPIALLVCAIAIPLAIIAAIVLWRLRRRETFWVKPCPNCGKTVLIAYEVCPACGTSLPH